MTLDLAQPFSTIQDRSWQTATPANGFQFWPLTTSGTCYLNVTVWWFLLFIFLFARSAFYTCRNGTPVTVNLFGWENAWVDGLNAQDSYHGGVIFLSTPASTQILIGIVFIHGTCVKHLACGPDSDRPPHFVWPTIAEHACGCVE